MPRHRASTHLGNLGQPRLVLGFRRFAKSFGHDLVLPVNDTSGTVKQVSNKLCDRTIGEFRTTCPFHRFRTSCKPSVRMSLTLNSQTLSYSSRQDLTSSTIFFLCSIVFFCVCVKDTMGRGASQISFTWSTKTGA